MLYVLVSMDTLFPQNSIVWNSENKKSFFSNNNNNMFFFRGPHCVVLFPFKAETPGELSISEGDKVQLIEWVDGGEWLKGRLGASEGTFPAQFVDIIEDLPEGSSTGPGPKGVLINDFMPLC